MTADGIREKIASRAFRDDQDFWSVRHLLAETYRLTVPGFNWEVRRWDGWRFYTDDPKWKPEWERLVRLWHTPAGLLICAVFPEGSGNAHLQVHPDYRFLEEEMIDWAVGSLSVTGDVAGQKSIDICAFEYDELRQRLLTERGFEKTSRSEVIRRMVVGCQQAPRPELAGTYAMREIRPQDEDDSRRIADILNAAFGRSFHTATEHQVFAANAPSYRHDLDLAAVAPDGTFAAYVGVPYDSLNRCGIFEPVCTHPDHRRKGLARALMLEGIRRLTAIGATEVLVGTGDQAAANQLYESIGFTEAHKGRVWRKIF